MSTLEQLVVAAETDFIGAQDPAALENAKAKYLGKTGLITEQMKGLGKLDPDARRAQGAVINEAKEKIESLLSARRQALADAQMQTRLNAEAIDHSAGSWPRFWWYSSGHAYVGASRSHFRIDWF